MKKLIGLFLGLTFGLCIRSFAGDSPYLSYLSTVVAANNLNSVLLSTGSVFIKDYLVLSTAATKTQTLNIYDGSVSTTTAIAKYEGYPMMSYGGVIALDIHVTSGAMIANNSTENEGKVRIRWLKLNRN